MRSPPSTRPRGTCREIGRGLGCATSPPSVRARRRSSEAIGSSVSSGRSTKGTPTPTPAGRSTSIRTPEPITSQRTPRATTIRRVDPATGTTRNDRGPGSHGAARSGSPGSGRRREPTRGWAPRPVRRPSAHRQAGGADLPRRGRCGPQGARRSPARDTRARSTPSRERTTARRGRARDAALRFLSASDKEYEGEILLGVATDTDDRTGAPLGPRPRRCR